MGNRKSLKSQNSTAKKMSVGKSVNKKFKKPDKRGRLLVKNLPFKVTEAEVKKYFSKYGQVNEVQLPRRDNGMIVGFGFVQFSKRTEAAKAVANTNGKELMGRTLEVSFALSKLSYIAARPDEVPVPSITGRQTSAEETVPITKHEKYTEARLPSMEPSDIDMKEETVNDDSTVGESAEKKKEKPLQKRGRLIVRNLPFQVTEEALKEHFGKFGEVHNVKLLRRPDGKLVGCGFVQFTWKQNAAKAIFKTSGKSFMGRTIVVDWAVPKNTYEAQIQQGEVTEDKIVPKEEVITIKEEDRNDEENYDVLPENKLILKKHRDSSSEDSDQSDVDGGIEDEWDGSVASDAESQTQQQTVSHDVKEGCTVFVKNIPFSATGEQLRACMQQFGDVLYAVVCIDPLTEHSKGTGFVKFKSKESAEQCLAAGEDLSLRGQQLELLPALPRQEIVELVHNNKTAARSRDSRNLYLVKEGVVVAGSHAATGVSAADMARRLQLEQWKSQILRNLNMFVSRTRLVVHNLPSSWDDAKLRQLFTQHAPAGAFFKEARVMRDMRDVDLHGVARSKEYGFVTFDSHEAALHALRSINNNPKIFTPAKRPIVSFSIENKAILNVKQRRLQKSLDKNPLSSGRERRKERTSEAQGNSRTEERLEEGTEKKWFAGMAAKPGVVKMRSRFKLKTQAAVHNETLRQEKRRRKEEKQAAQLKQSGRTSTPHTQVKTKKKNLKSEEKAEEIFSKLVDKYKNKLSSMSKVKKWYE